ncbi:MAG TPA: hypothetical protein VIK45_12690 [Candidatus Dormibacteraeota bacterium]
MELLLGAEAEQAIESNVTALNSHQPAVRPRPLDVFPTPDIGPS